MHPKHFMGIENVVGFNVVHPEYERIAKESKRKPLFYLVTESYPFPGVYTLVCLLIPVEPGDGDKEDHEYIPYLKTSARAPAA